MLSIAFMLYCLVCAGAFGIEEMVSASGPGMTVLLLCVMPLIWARPVSALVAECNSFLPCEGGIYVWCKEAFGEFWGFQAGWWNSISTYVSSGTYIALIAGYISQIVPLDDTGLIILKVGVILLFTVINLAGLKEVSWVSEALSVLIVLMFAAVTVIGFSNACTNPIEPFLAEEGNTVGSLAEGLSIAIWMYCGYECIATMSGEFDNPKIVARGLKIALPLIAFTYILPTIGALSCLPEGSWELWGVDGGLEEGTVGYANVLGLAFGDVGRILFLSIAVLAQGAIFNTYVASGSRSFFVLSEDHLFPRIVSRVDAGGRSPYIGVLSITVSALIFAQFDFTFLVEMEIIFILALYVILALAVIKLRKKYPVEQRNPESRYIIRGGKIGLWYCVILPIVICIVTLLLNGVTELIIAAVGLATGIIAYILFKKIYGGLTVENPVDFPKGAWGLAVGDGKRIAILIAIIIAILLYACIFI